MSGTEERYNRHHILEAIGKDGQERLIRSKVLIVGCGALGLIALATDTMRKI